MKAKLYYQSDTKVIPIMALLFLCSWASGAYFFNPYIIDGGGQLEWF